MKKSRLNIIQSENKTVIKKKPDIVQCVIFAAIFLVVVLFPVISERARGIPLFWVFYTFCMWANIAKFLSVLFGKIVVDTDKKEISIYNLCRETRRFDEIKELKIIAEDDDPEGLDTYKVCILFKSGHKNELETADREQAEEILELLNPIIIQPHEEGRDPR